MSDAPDNLEEENLKNAVSGVIDELMAEGKVVFDNEGVLAIDSDGLADLSYVAICRGFGFTPGFLPPYHNNLSDDLENEAYGFIAVLDEVDQDRTTFYLHKLDRNGLEHAMLYWYELGYGLRQVKWGFPYSDGVSADEFMAMSEEERKALLERD